MDAYEKYLFFIELCRANPPTENIVVHHIKPRCFGGLDDPGNLIPLSRWQHCEAHYLICLSLPVGSAERRKMIFAFKQCVSALMKELHS
jgi:hypothetical protein